jgi:ClpP class serine protease
MANDIGSVINGQEAVGCGLIDRIGGLSDALACLRAMAQEKRGNTENAQESPCTAAGNVIQ